MKEKGDIVRKVGEGEDELIFEVPCTPPTHALAAPLCV
jgi:hypothetical protein